MIDFTNPISKNDLKYIFNKIYNNKHIIDNTFFHFKANEIKNIEYNEKLCFKRLQQNFNQYNNILKSIPNNYKNGSRNIIDTFNINYDAILSTINVFKIKNKNIPLIYEFLLKKLVKQIIHENISLNIQYIDINITNNILILEINNIKKEYKLIKFIKKYQKLYPQKYKNCYVDLIISNNWKDILFQSTFKQWTSCTNILNSTTGKFLYNTPVEEILNEDYIVYLVIHNNIHTIDKIMDDIGPNSLSYEYCIWRSIVHAFHSIDNQVLYCPELTAYGIPSHAGLSYYYKIFQKILQYIYNLNNQQNFIFNKNVMVLSTKSFFSDIYGAKATQHKIRLFKPGYIPNKREITIINHYISMFTRRNYRII